MLDVSMINIGNKCYSVKTKLSFEDERQTVRMSILNVEEVVRTSQTSFTKIKTVYSNEFR